MTPKEEALLQAARSAAVALVLAIDDLVVEQEPQPDPAAPCAHPDDKRIPMMKGRFHCSVCNATIQN